MRKLIFSLFIFGTFAAYIYYEKNIAKGFNVSSTVTKFKTTVPIPTKAPVVTGAGPLPTPQGKYKDGIYLGPVANAFYGELQVKVTVTGGKITDVHFVKYPSDRRTSLEINQLAMPLLVQEAIIAQSAEVDGVSGATQTSKAFIESLEAALNQAS
jgi:uncharacterized protein with FMN-binding domain